MLVEARRIELRSILDPLWGATSLSNDLRSEVKRPLAGYSASSLVQSLSRAYQRRHAMHFPKVTRSPKREKSGFSGSVQLSSESVRILRFDN